MKTTILSVALALALSGCSTVPVQVDKGPIHAQTFSFINRAQRAIPQYADNRAAVLERVQEAIATNLVAKGLTQEATGGDVTVAFLVIVGNNVTTMAVNDYFGYSEDSAKLLNKIHEEDTGEGGQRGYYESGTLVIDIVNPSTQELLWRGSIQRQVLRNLPTEQRLARLQETVDAILKNLVIVH
jgi:hypothetical protein